MRVVVTGASGFIGSLACSMLSRIHEVVPLNRRATGAPSERVLVDFRQPKAVRHAVAGADAVVHLAGRAHVSEADSESAREFRHTNLECSRVLLEQSAEAGIDRFVFISSIAVMGTGQALEYSGPGYAETDQTGPVTEYGSSKLLAEATLAERAAVAGVCLTILRPPLVFGPGAPGNLARLRAAIARGRPMPFAAVRNRRTLVSREGLVEAIRLALERIEPGGRTYHIGHVQTVSTEQIVRALAAEMGRPPRLFPVPVEAVRRGFDLLGRAEVFQKLWGSFVVDASRIRRELGWQDPLPPVSGIS